MKILELFAYLCVSDAGAAIAFYTEAFGATEKFRLTEPSGRVGHAEIELGGHTVMIAEEFPECGIRGPAHFGGTPVQIHLHVDDADLVVRRAAQAGAKIVRQAEDHFYGERSGTIEDPFGHRWLIGHHIEDVSTDEMQRRYTELVQRSDAQR